MTERVDTIVRGGLVATSTGEFHASIAIRGEQIVAVGPDDTLPEANEYVDATGKHVLPGAIDCHVHLRDAPNDDWDVGSVAAARAGLTTIIPFGAYDGAAGETLPQAIERWKAEAARDSVVDYTFHYILSNTPYIIDGLAEAISMGVTSFKMFMTYDHRVPDSFIARAMAIVGANGGIVQLHAENGDVIDYLMNKAIAEGRTAPTDFPATCPTWAEAEAINRGVLMGAMTDCPVYIVHLSTQEGLERIKEAQRLGQRVWTETCPQYLLLDETIMERMGPLAKIGPPLRPADGVNQGAMWQGSEQGYISAIGSDHSPGPPERKKDGWTNIFRSPDGAPVPVRRTVAGDAGAARLRRGRRQARPTPHLDGPRAGRKPRPHIRAVSPQGRDPAGRGRRPAHHRPRRRDDHHRGRPPRPLRLHALRGPTGEGQDRHHHPARQSAAARRQARTVGGLRALPPRGQPHAANRRLSEVGDQHDGLSRHPV